MKPFTRPFSPFPDKPWYLLVGCTSLSKKLGEKEKLLIMSNFSFSHCAFYPFEEISSIFIKFEIVISKLFQFGRAWNLSFGKQLTLYQTTCLLEWSKLDEFAIHKRIVGPKSKFVLGRVENIVWKIENVGYFFVCSIFQVHFWFRTSLLIYLHQHQCTS